MRKNAEEIKEAREAVREMPIDNSKRERLIEKLQNTNMNHCTDEDLLQLSTLFYTTIEEWEEELGEETGKVHRCEYCGKECKTKSTLGKHIKNDNEECAQWYYRNKIAIKFCENNNCNFMHRNEKILKRRQREDCNGEEREWHPAKRTKVDRIKAIAGKRSEATEIAGGQIRKIEEDEWECVTCGRRKKAANIKSLIGHLGRHNRNTQVGRKQEPKK